MKNKKLIITIVAIVAIFLIAAIVYPKLSSEQKQTSYQPTINTAVVEKGNEIKAPEVTVSEDTKAKEDETATETSTTDTSNSEDNKTEATTVAPDASTPTQENNTETNTNETDTETEAEDSRMLPNFPITRLDGTTGNVQDELVAGQPTVINLFASWCPPCKAEMPNFIAAAKLYEGKVNFMFFDSFDGSRETQETINDFVENEGFASNANIYLDPGYISSVFNTQSIPITIFLDKEGNVDHGYQGMISETVLNDDIKALLD